PHLQYPARVRLPSMRQSSATTSAGAGKNAQSGSWITQVGPPWILSGSSKIIPSPEVFGWWFSASTLQVGVTLQGIDAILEKLKSPVPIERFDGPAHTNSHVKLATKIITNAQNNAAATAHVSRRARRPTTPGDQSSAAGSTAPTDINQIGNET